MKHVPQLIDPLWKFYSSHSTKPCWLEATVAGDAPRMRKLQKRVLSLGRIYTVGRHASGVIKGLKCALSLLGIRDDVMAEPFHRFFAPQRGKVEEFLRALDGMSDDGLSDPHATDAASTDVSNR